VSLFHFEGLGMENAMGGMANKLTNLKDAMGSIGQKGDRGKKMPWRIVMAPMANMS